MPELVPPPPPPPPSPGTAPSSGALIGLNSPDDLAFLALNLRHEKGMNQREFADHCGVGRRFIQDLERGKASLRFDKVNAVLRANGVVLKADPSG